MRYPLTAYTRGEMGRRSVSQTRDAAFRGDALRKLIGDLPVYDTGVPQSKPDVEDDGVALKSMAHPTRLVGRRVYPYTDPYFMDHRTVFSKGGTVEWADANDPTDFTPIKRETQFTEQALAERGREFFESK